MAGDWIKFEMATLDKPEVLMMAETLNLSPDEVIGKLLRVWSWFDKNSIDGNAGGVTGVTLMSHIDRLVTREGFASAMKKVGWLGANGVPHFDRHNGKSAKKRALGADRTANHRNANRDADVTHNALPEKRRSKDLKEAHPPGPDGPSPSGLVFGEGLDSLVAAGIDEPNARRFLGMCLSQWEETYVREALLAAVDKAEPISYARKVLASKPRKPKLPKGCDAVLAKLREKYPAIRLASDGQAFYDPHRQVRFTLAGEMVVA